SNAYVKNLGNGTAPKFAGNAAELSSTFRSNERLDPEGMCNGRPTGYMSAAFVLQTQDGERLGVTAGADLYLVLAVEPSAQATNIIKWYELY
ncbi:MAG TPA: hypothetical protein PLZ43_12725, partial [bacterium]|nr:hypothetical protein [bacterium]